MWGSIYCELSRTYTMKTLDHELYVCKRTLKHAVHIFMQLKLSLCGHITICILFQLIMSYYVSNKKQVSQETK